MWTLITENMGTPDAVVILDQVRYHTNTGLRSISEDRDALKMSWLITLEAQFFQPRHSWNRATASCATMSMTSSPSTTVVLPIRFSSHVMLLCHNIGSSFFVLHYIGTDETLSIKDLAPKRNDVSMRDSHCICVVVLEFLVKIKQDLIFIMVELKSQGGNHPR